MASRLHIGCCGWSYFREREFRAQLGEKRASKLQSYAVLFDLVEVNSTFYQLPKSTTAQKWRSDTTSVNEKFEFAVKAYQGITHIERFGEKSFKLFDETRDTATALQSRIVLFQTPPSFGPSAENIEQLKKFFSKTGRAGLTLAWEPRGKWYEDPPILASLCEELDVVHCVDPFRNQPLLFGKANVAYFRLHGFGKPSVYQYDFSDAELKKLIKMVEKLPEDLRDVYVLFNNAACYKNALTFKEMEQKRG